ncbi:MAG: recombinase family protein [Limisphaerales bacterium]
MKKKKAFSYLRVSGKGQIAGDGFPRQRATIAKYAKRNRIEVVREFVERGVSGTKDAFEREALTELLVAIKAGDVRIVIVENADRLARDLMVSEFLLAEFRKLGVKVIAADGDADLTVGDDDPTRTLIRQVLGAFAQFNKSTLVQKLKVARVRMRQAAGRCEGRKPYGFTSAEKSIMDRMRAWKKSGMTLAAIAEQLNAENIPPRTVTRDGQKSKWHPTTVQRILARKDRRVITP